VAIIQNIGILKTLLISGIVLLSGCLLPFSGIASQSAGSALSAQSDVTQPERLEQLSLKELMSIPLNGDYSSFKIYQSDSNPIGPDTINFGILAPITEFPTYSGEIIAAADLAAELINQQGGINGKRLSILRADDKENTEVSARLARELVEKYRVQAIIGPATSNSTLDVLQKVTLPTGVPLISQAASSMVLTDIAAGHPFWRMVANNQQQIGLITELLHQQMGHQRIFLVTGRDIYGRELKAGIEEYFAKQKNSKTFHLAISDKVFLEVMDLTDEIKAMQQQGVTAIVLTLVNSQVAPMIRKIKKTWQGPYPIILIADTVTPKYLEEANLGDINACIFSYVGTNHDLDPSLSQKIEAAIKTKATGFDGAYVYDATIILAMAKVLQQNFNLPIKSAVEVITGDGYPINPNDFSRIKTLYPQHKSFSFYGYSGRVHFNDKGDNLSAFKTIYSLAQNPAETQKRCIQVKR
jgi:ABC-type branched-subunit amino acid transport system substrate-binding protein